MRKHRLYGVVIAVLLGMGFVPRPSAPHHAVRTDSGRSVLQLVSAVFPVDVHFQTAPVDVANAVVLRPVRAHYVVALDAIAAYEKAHAPAPAPVTAAATFVGRSAPPVTPAPAPVHSAAPSATSSGVWAALRQCESGGNYAENTGNGYYGAYQFSPATWHGLGYPGLPSDAAPAVQDRAAEQLQARSGWGQWPACSRRLGL